MNFEEERKKKTAQIEQILKEYLPEPAGEQRLIMEAMEYSVMAGGKRLRPMLMWESYRLFHGTSKAVYPFMAALEMIHTYSLVHDDLPAMDNDDYRRGRKTTHVVYGEDIGILAGDALLNYAFETAGTAFDLEQEDYRQIGRAMQILAKKAGVYGMLGGQVVDVKNSGQSVSGEIIPYIYELKTGALIESAMMIGAVLAGASQEAVESMERIAGNVGMAFQIQDDILDVTGSAETLGKPVHSDEKNEKNTYVTWKGLDASREEVARLSKEAVRELAAFKPEDDFLEQLLLSLIHREK